MEKTNIEQFQRVKLNVNNLSPELVLRMSNEVEQAKLKEEKKVG
ncbi:hypothetical protein [Paenibacillus sp. FSL R10-2734]